MSETRCCLSKLEAPADLILQDDALVGFAYLNQGGANVIFKILPWSTGNRQPFFFIDRRPGKDTAVHQRDVTSQVIRIDKGLDKTLRCDEVVSGFYGHVRPLFVSGEISVIDVRSTGLPVVKSVSLLGIDFTKHLMEHQGVQLYPNVLADLMSKSDSILAVRKEEEKQAKAPRRWGILLPDMSPTAGASVTIEVKPKWLAQSPNAPSDAVRCRTCAMQVAKPKDLNNYICPLRLAGDTSDVLYQWILDRVTEQLIEHSTTVSEQRHQAPPVASSIATYLTKGDGRALLQHLKFLQTQLDPQGVSLREKMQPKSTFDHNLRLAMTLRDCSLYITAHYNTSSIGAIKVDSKLGDLDFKSADKIDDWMSKEESLLKESAYTREVKDDLRCLLER